MSDAVLRCVQGKLGIVKGCASSSEVKRRVTLQQQQRRTGEEVHGEDILSEKALNGFQE